MEHALEASPIRIQAPIVKNYGNISESCQTLVKQLWSQKQHLYTMDSIYLNQSSKEKLYWNVEFC